MSINSADLRERRRIKVTGTVQGVGYRPFVYGAARKLNIAGWVMNTPDGVLIEAEGDAAALAALKVALSAEAPPLAKVTGIHVQTIPAIGEKEFIIRPSITPTGARTQVPPDIATCPDCLRDIADPANRRFNYPFTNCTNCGPRLSIIKAIPYDRPNTTMAAFTMCPDCQAEYDDPDNRRFHAQPNACPVCGPHLSLLQGSKVKVQSDEESGDDAPRNAKPGAKTESDAALITKTATKLSDGKVVTIKGLGGFHVACDARNDAAVKLLRTRKGRADKAFAIMVRDIEEARRVCDLTPAHEALLLAPERPIVLAPARADSGVSAYVAPGSRRLGIMLPYTPLHALLLEQAPPALVMTSGNLSEEPIAYQDDEARTRLKGIADLLLTHNRPIHLAVDDSVTAVLAGAPALLRRARGYVPAPIALDFRAPTVLACGGDLKSTFCLTRGKEAILSQHLGDLVNSAALDNYRHVVAHFQKFYDLQPTLVAHDLHPDYVSTRYAKSLAGPHVAVQHHHAHIVSCMAEHGLDGNVIGVAFDGTGYGTDGTIWGGEILIATRRAFRRFAHLAYLHMPGGEAAIRHPARMAYSYLNAAYGAEAEAVAVELLPSLIAAERLALRHQLETNLNSPLTSSVGRLFDAVSALLGVCNEVTYEGQAAMELEALADPTERRPYPVALLPGDTNNPALLTDMRDTVKAIVADVREGIPVPVIAGRFHATVATAILAACQRARTSSRETRVVLTGGVFQNDLLLTRAVELLEADGFTVFRHSLVPCNDGGIALGQAVVAAAVGPTMLSGRARTRNNMPSDYPTPGEVGLPGFRTREDG